MSTDTATPVQAAAPLTRRNTIGLWLCVLLSLADIAALATLGGSDDAGTNGPPVAVLLFCAVLGVIGLVLAFVIRRRHSRPAARLLAVTRIISALTSVPAFFVDDVPAGLVVATAAAIVITVIAAWLLLARPGN